MKTNLMMGSFAVLLLLSLTLAACGGSKEPAADLDGKALVEERCTVCHTIENVTSASKSGDAWTSTVERMIGKGAQLSDAEKEAVIAYLTEAYPE